MLNIANQEKGEDWVLSLPEWEHGVVTSHPSASDRLLGSRRRVLLAIVDRQ